MPTSSNAEGEWIRLDHPRMIPDLTLDKSEVKEYLAWQFSAVARKPQAMTLRETAAAVRYMRWLSLEGIPKEAIARGSDSINQYLSMKRSDGQEIHQRNAVERIANIVWGDLLAFGQFEPGTNRDAKLFFEKHVGQWQHPWLESAFQFIDKFDIPPGRQQPFRANALVGKNTVIQGQRNPYLDDDLSERIAAADYVVREAIGRSRRSCIATALNASVQTRKPAEEWGPDEVRNGVRAYARQKSAMSPSALGRKWLARYRGAVYVRTKAESRDHADSEL